MRKRHIITTIKDRIMYNHSVWKASKDYAKIFEEYIPELGNPVDFPHDAAYHNRPAPVAWSGINFHK